MPEVKPSPTFSGRCPSRYLPGLLVVVFVVVVVVLVVVVLEIVVEVVLQIIVRIADVLKTDQLSAWKVSAHERNRLPTFYVEGAGSGAPGFALSRAGGG